MDSFKLLLNEISHQLTEQNLQSLINISNIPGASRHKMNDGWAVFNYLIRVDNISKEKIGNLRNLMRKIRPRRRDLVRLVDNYIKKEFHTNDVRTVLDDFTESWEEIGMNSASDPTLANSNTALIHIDCACMNWINCHRFPSWYKFIVSLWIVGIIATGIFWYPSDPEINAFIKENHALKVWGKVVFILEILALVAVLVCCPGGRFCCCPKARRPDQTPLINPTIQGESPSIRPSTSAVVEVPTHARKFERQISSQPSESAVFCGSSVSTAPASVSTYGTQ